MIYIVHFEQCRIVETDVRNDTENEEYFNTWLGSQVRSDWKQNFIPQCSPVFNFKIIFSFSGGWKSRLKEMLIFLLSLYKIIFITSHLPYCTNLLAKVWPIFTKLQFIQFIILFSFISRNHLLNKSAQTSWVS